MLKIWPNVSNLRPYGQNCVLNSKDQGFIPAINGSQFASNIQRRGLFQRGSPQYNRHLGIKLFALLVTSLMESTIAEAIDPRKSTGAIQKDKNKQSCKTR